MRFKRRTPEYLFVFCLGGGKTTLAAGMKVGAIRRVIVAGGSPLGYPAGRREWNKVGRCKLNSVDP